MPDERRFTEDEARAIFAHAARVSPPVPSTSGLTLAELQRAGAEAGLDPAAVAAAAVSLARDEPAPKTTWGMPTELRRRRVFPSGVDDAAWEAMVGHLREVYGGPGTAGQTGRVREWTSPGPYDGGGNRGQVHVTARPLEGGMTEVTIELLNVKQYVQLVQVFGSMFGMMGLALLPALYLFTDAGGAGVVFSLALLVVALITVVGGGSSVRSMLRRSGDRAEATLDRLDLIARGTTAPTRIPATASPRLALPTDDAPETSAGDRTGDRLRTG